MQRNAIWHPSEVIFTMADKIFPVFILQDSTIKKVNLRHIYVFTGKKAVQFAL
jgi:hypothetical protein